MNTFKQSLCLFTSIFVVSYAFAGDMGPKINESILTQNGAYLSGSLGIINMQLKDSRSYLPETHQLSSTGILGGGYGGYDFGLTQHFRVAIEGFMDAVGVSNSIIDSNGSVKNSQRYQAGGRILPQYVFSPDVTGHWILGYVNGRFLSEGTGDYGNYSQDYNLNGFQTGLGFTTIVKKNIFVRLDAYYNLYSGTSFLSDNTPSSLITKGPGNLIGELSLIYKFS